MDKETAERILAEKAKRDAAIREQFAPEPLPVAVSEPVPEVVAPVDDSVVDVEDIVTEEEPEPRHEPEETPGLTLSEQAAQLTNEYIQAQKEIELAKQRLVDFRGSEEALTEDDLLTLENLCDLIRLRYERLLET